MDTTKATVVKGKEYGDLSIVFDTPYDESRRYILAWGLGGHGGCHPDWVSEGTVGVSSATGRALLEQYVRLYKPDETYEYVSRKQFLNHVFEEA